MENIMVQYTFVEFCVRCRVYKTMHNSYFSRSLQHLANQQIAHYCVAYITFHWLLNNSR